MASFGNMTSQMGNANQVLNQPTALNQVGPSSASFNPMLMGMPQGPSSQQGLPQAPQMASMGAPGPISQPFPQAPQGQSQIPPTVGMPPAIPESTHIIKALINRLEMQGKHESAVRDHLFPQQPKI